ncbi:5-hydroxytryptamine receptor 4-like isoform X3 [Gigantopelta aegis]|uniref:5-hydroxytryptamine receptor 4-like isoform X3 n=1 Tax=Gigantopelta aegis TaxID=1735272 RepID=UPI001B88A92A|nr:5-hydroxytryptamine receptor 4-like isoform X3 [Gigantopelta aegis]XP_041371450.1 5-hydroxytryptamine receptor 4-like isoform X3 [Gigantopelta aegis]XP_041371451.1 5-hydroxytryptamine receptor 4-like isoform X3 [Gigantopelta aegis]
MNNTSTPCDDELPGTRYSIAAIIVLCLLAVLGMAVNMILILAIIACKRLRNLPNLFVLSRAVADLGVCVLVMPFGIYKYHHYSRWVLGHQLCLVFGSITVMLFLASILHILMIAVHRYIVICHPTYQKHMGLARVLIMLSICWLIPLCFSFPPIMNEWHAIGLSKTIPCFSFRKRCLIMFNMTYAIICGLIMYYIPAGIMVFCHMKLRFGRPRRLSIISTDQNDVVMVRTLSILMACFGLCWTPEFVGRTIDPLLGYVAPSDLWVGFYFLGCFNSVVNPFVYYLSSSNFRYNIHKLIMCQICCSRDDGVLQMNEQEAEASDMIEPDSMEPDSTILPAQPIVMMTLPTDMPKETTLPTETVKMPNATTTTAK